MPDLLEPASRPAAPFAAAAMSWQAIRLANRLAVRRRPAVVTVAGVEAAIDGPTLPSERPAPAADAIPLDLRLGGRPARMHLPRVVARRIAAQADPALAHAEIDDAGLRVLADCLLAPALDALERVSGLTVDLASPTGEPPADGCALSFALRGKALPAARLVLVTDFETAERLADAHDARPAAPAGYRELPVAACWRIGVAALAVGELRSLGTGDVVLCDDPALDRGRAMLVLAERWLAPAALSDGRATLAEPPAAAAAGMRSWIMDRSERKQPAAGRGDGPPAEGGDAALDDLPVQLAFELGRCEIPLGELRAMDAGRVFALGRDPDDPVDILANGRRIGSGRIVRIGESLGIQVTRLFGNA